VALRKIATIGHPVLRERAREVTPSELADASTQQLIDDLVATMRDANGAGLAANQVHVPMRICAIEVAENPRYPYMPSWPLTILVNPVLEPSTRETFLNFEGCLSVPNLRGQVPRFTGASIRALDRHGSQLDFVVLGLTAGTFQHELDHLDGTLFVDRVVDTRTLCTLDAFDRFHRKEFATRARDLVARFGS
jgi:peptide deformylase